MRLPTVRFSVLWLLVLLTLGAYGITCYRVYIKQAPLAQEDEPVTLHELSFLNETCAWKID